MMGYGGYGAPGYPPPGGYGAYPGAPPAGYPPYQSGSGFPPAPGFPPPAFPQPGYGYPPGYPGAPPGYPGYAGGPYPGHPPQGGQGAPVAPAQATEPRKQNHSSASVAEKKSKEPAEAAPVQPPEVLIVSGCQDATVSEIVCGPFTRQGENHGKPFYKRDTQANDLDVMLYYWDERDGDKFCGWWFGPKVGGDQVWAYHPERSTVLPPRTSWQVPYDGPADEKFDISPPPSKEAELPAEDRSHRQESAENRRNKQVEENRKKLEEAERRRISEQQRRMDEKKRQDEERAQEQLRREQEAKRRQEEEAQRKEDEVKRKKELEEKRRAEQKATLTIRRVIQKVRAATPETFDELHKELKATLDQELAHLSANVQKLQDEAEKGLEQAKKRIEQINESRKKHEEKHLEEERKRQKAVDVSRARVKELEQLVTSAEQVADSLGSVAETLENNDNLSVEDVASLAKSIENGAKDVNAKVTACTEFVLAKGTEMQDIPDPSSGDTPTEIGEATQRLLERVNNCTRKSDDHIAAARGFKDRAATRASARARSQLMQTTFKKYDKDGDGMLSRKEVSAFAKGEYSFLLSSDTLDTIQKNCVLPGERGVRFEKLFYMKISIGIARQVKIDRALQAKRREFEREVAELLKELQEKRTKVLSAVDKADQDISKTEALILSFKEAKRKAPATELFALADATEATIADAKVAWQDARSEMESTGEGIEPRFQEVFKEFSYQHLKSQEMRVGRMEARVTRTVNLTARLRDRAQRQASAEFASLRMAAACLVRHCQCLNRWSKDEVFEQFDSDGDGVVRELEFLAFFDRANKVIQEDRSTPVVPPEDGAPVEEEEPPKEGPGEAVKEAVPAMTEFSSLGLAAPQPKRQAKPAADLPVSSPAAPSGPAGLVEVSKADAARLFKALCDADEDVVSKEKLLESCRTYMTVVKETVMTSTRSIKDSPVLRRLVVDEVVEVLDGPMRETANGLIRIRCKALREGMEGWATSTSNQGTSLLKEGGSLPISKTPSTSDLAAKAK